MTGDIPCHGLFKLFRWSAASTQLPMSSTVQVVTSLPSLCRPTNELLMGNSCQFMVEAS